MKKLSLFLMVLLGICYSYAQINVNESFESGSGNSYPAGWYASSSGVQIITENPCSGNNAIAGLLGGSFSGSYNIIYSSWQSSGQALSLSLQYNTLVLDTGYTVAGNIRAEYSINGGTSWNLITSAVLSDPVPNCYTLSGTIPSGAVPVDSDFRLRITGEINGSNAGFRLNMDDVQLTQAASCYYPSAVTATNITSNNALITWTAPSAAPAGGYELYYSTSATVPLSSAVPSFSGIAGTSQNLASSLSPNTNYYVWVRSVCGTADRSAWSQPGSFKTDCSAVSTLSENFDTYSTGTLVPDCWMRIISGNGNQSISSSSPASGTRNMYQYSTGAANQTVVVLPTLSNINAGTNWLKFKARVSSGTGALDVGYITDTGNVSTFVPLQKVTVTNTAYDASSIKTVSVPSSVPSGARLAVRNNGVDGPSVGVYWDDVVWETMPSCQFPVNIIFSNITTSSVTVSWTAPLTVPAGGYEYYYSTTSTAPAASATASGTVSSPSLSLPAGTLSANTVYYFWVRSVCSSTDKSDWTSVVSFRTPCNAVSTLSENFDSYSVGNVVPNCWDRIISGAGMQTISSSGPASGTRNLYQYSSSAYNQTIVVLPYLSNVNAGNYRLKLKAKVLSGTGKMEIGYVTDLIASSFVPLQSFDISNTTYTAAYNISLDIPASVPANARLAVRNPGLSTSGFYWDDVVWENTSQLGTQDIEGPMKGPAVYPNPFHDVITITGAKGLQKILVRDFSGRILRTVAGNTAEISLKELPAGTYLLELQDQDAARRTFRIIKK